MAIDSSTSPLTAYAGISNNGIYKSTDGGVTWTSFSTGLPNVSTTNPAGLVVDPASPATVYLAFGSVIYKNDNSGTGWTDLGVTGLSGSPLRALAIDSNGLYLHTADSVAVFDFQIRSGCCS